VLSKFAVQVRETVRKHQMLVPHDRVVVGVSGGADSVSLLLVLNELGYNAAVAHVNHGLRGAESDEDEAFTADLADALDLPFFSRKICLDSGNIETRGRDARRDFFRELVMAEGFNKVALAHTRNDRVETFLLNLLRGSGAQGLASMLPVSGATVRPLIESAREDVERSLLERKQGYRKDASNSDLRFTRNRLRHAVIPELASAFNPNLLQTLSRTIQILEDEDAFLRTLSEVWLAENGTKQGSDFVLPVKLLDKLPAALTRRIVRAALRNAGSNLQDVGFDHTEAIRLILAGEKSGKLIEIPYGIHVAREFDRLVFRRGSDRVREYEYLLKIPGEVHIPELGKIFRAEVMDGVEAGAGPKGSVEQVFVDAESIGPYVRIRNWKPGDYYRPVGLPAGKLKKLFQRARIPRSHRTSWPVIIADSTIIWVASFPVSREFAPRGHSQKIVAFEAVQI
jgi:tRNA(Ile)-lysidine synthase